jgi:mRNA-degrading endonuclease RelE of RelBE toxin-antitoxin system
MEFRIEFSNESQREFERLRIFKRRRVYDSIHSQLQNRPEVESRNLKCLGDRMTANFVYVPPLWELRVDDVRIFHEVDSEQAMVYVHAVRIKPPNRTTAQVLHETD